MFRRPISTFGKKSTTKLKMSNATIQFSNFVLSPYKRLTLVFKYYLKKKGDFKRPKYR